MKKIDSHSIQAPFSFSNTTEMVVIGMYIINNVRVLGLQQLHSKKYF